MDIRKLFDNDEFRRWFSQAENTLNSASHDLDSGDYNWCCFKCQQAAEYSVKAILRGLGQIAVGHSVLRLVGELEEAGSSISEELKAYARSLDKHYIPARYPDAYPAGAPFEFYDENVAKEAIEHARSTLEFVVAEKNRYV
jgi:HEPN domain-containing protein